MELIEAIKNRYSCRNYSDKPVEKKIIEELLELANRAPSTNNWQNRQFIVVTKIEDRQWLLEMNNQPYLAEAPVDIIMTTKLDTGTVEEYLKQLKDWEMTHDGKNPEKVEVTEKIKNEVREIKYKWMISDVAAAVENLMLAATDKGLGTCWIGVLDAEGIIKRFNLPEGIVPVCVVTLGYEKEAPKNRTKRKPIEELVHWERW